MGIIEIPGENNDPLMLPLSVSKQVAEDKLRQLKAGMAGTLPYVADIPAGEHAGFTHVSENLWQYISDGAANSHAKGSYGFITLAKDENTHPPTNEWHWEAFGKRHEKGVETGTPDGLDKAKGNVYRVCNGQ